MTSNSNGHASKRRPLRVLFVEDSESDAVLLTLALERGGFEPAWKRIDTRAGMETCLGKSEWDLILADHSMPKFSAPEALELVKQREIDIPFIIVSGHIDEETATATMRAGAHDYIMKNRLARLVPAVERELREAEVRRDLRRAHVELEARVEKRTAALKAANVKLQSVIEERRRLEIELLEIAENERRRIGFDLHDDLGQKLTGLSLMAKGLQHRLANEAPALAEEARRIHGLIEETIHHTHDLAHNFSSLDVRGDDLRAVLKDLAANVKKTFEIPCTVSAKGSIPELPENTTLQLYKIAQEAISNAIKHGKASQVSIALVKNAAGLSIIIKNDGRPFVQPAHPTKRMGLRIMNYRASMVGASLEIASDKSSTTVRCTLPDRTLSKAPPGSSNRSLLEAEEFEVEAIGTGDPSH